MNTKDLFIEGESIADSFIKSFDVPYEILPNIGNIIMEIGNNLDDNYEKIGDNIWIHKNAKVDKTVSITGPCIIDDGAEVRVNAFLRGKVLIGKNCVFGNSCEAKNAILYDGAKVPHFSYVGDSILGNGAHLGASAIISNFKSDGQNIKIKTKDGYIETGLRKFGAMVGDYVEVGCGCVLNPGTVIMPYSNVYPLTSVRGLIESEVIVKSMDKIVVKERK